MEDKCAEVKFHLAVYKSGFSIQLWSLNSFQKKIFWNTYVQISKRLIMCPFNNSKDTSHI